MQAGSRDDAGVRARLYLNIGVTAHRDLVEAEIPHLRGQCRSFFL